MKKQSGRRKALQTASAYQRAFKSITFEDFLRNNANKEGLSGSEFRLVLSNELPDGTLQFYCHPFGRDGETYDAYVWHFDVEPKESIDNLMKYLRENSVK